MYGEVCQNNYWALNAPSETHRSWPTTQNTGRSCTGFNPVKEGGTNIAGPQAVVEIQDRCNVPGRAHGANLLEWNSVGLWGGLDVRIALVLPLGVNAREIVRHVRRIRGRCNCSVNPKGVEPDRMCVLSRKGNHRVEELDGMHCVPRCLSTIETPEEVAEGGGESLGVGTVVDLGSVYGTSERSDGTWKERLSVALEPERILRPGATRCNGGLKKERSGSELEWNRDISRQRQVVVHAPRGNRRDSNENRV
ncbi:hypothetical protein DFH08DRAFT_944965 [Mycena albidolilacea]|uniref:Uncharacterized protein n=1 Tax=Mycena albidolilacea TaxID=1033008 RepID=A0AAD7E9Y3_9AGAR|nr:hypothetical protein DFH08DRAFT_944965 [Mycena albidolilacea]